MFAERVKGMADTNMNTEALAYGEGGKADDELSTWWRYLWY